MSNIKNVAMITVCGRPNVGKSSLTNALVGEKVAIVSNKAQTTRNRIYGVVNREDTQFVLLDTPGLHKPRSRLGDYMVKVVRESLADVECAVLLVEPIAHVGEPEKILLERIREIRASERRAYQKIADVFEQCSYDYDKNSDTTKAFYAFVQNKLHYAVTGKTAAELISERANLDSPTMGLTTWKGAPDGKILKSDTLVAKNYLNEKEISRLNRLVTMFIDYAELMAEDEQLMSMQDWLNETDRFLQNNRRNVLDGKGSISHDAAVKKVSGIYSEFRKKQDAEYISEFDRQTAKYLKGE